ncbi:MAG: hypothetical protein KY410_09775, partial [Proteobacteria bacterium]|nr:hypothetical protein [Pseudomonadota bacterium]
LSESVSAWSGKARLTRSERAHFKKIYRSLARYEMQGPERFRYRGCKYFLRQARKSLPEHWVREAWLLELSNWKHLLTIGACWYENPEWVPPNPYLGKGPEIHYHKFVGHPLF